MAVGLFALGEFFFVLFDLFLAVEGELLLLLVGFLELGPKLVLLVTYVPMRNVLLLLLGLSLGVLLLLFLHHFLLYDLFLQSLLQVMAAFLLLQLDIHALGRPLHENLVLR